MRKINLFVAICLATSVAFAQEKTTEKSEILIKGSEALWSYFFDLSKNYMAVNKETYIKVDGSGSTLGILSLIEGHSDIAVSTRKITAEEELEFKSAGKKLKEIKIGKEALVIITNVKNPVYKITKDEIGQVFSGQIKVWNKLGGENLPIRTFIRANNSGCYEGFKDLFLDPKNLSYDSKALMIKSNLDLKNHVKKSENSISFLGYSSMKNNNFKDIKMIKVGVDKNSYVEPTDATIADGTYPVTRDCFIYVEETKFEQLKPFLVSILSKEGQDLLIEKGFIGVDKLTVQIK